MTQLSIIIVNYASGQELASCLEALRQAAISLDYAVTVVNNDEPADLAPLRGMDFPQLQIIQNSRNLGFAAAINQGFRRVPAKSFLLLNPDVLVGPGSLEVLWKTLEAHPQAGIVTPRLTNPDGTLQYSCRRFYSYPVLLLRRFPFNRLFPNHSLIRHHLMLDWEHDTLGPVDWALGAALLIRDKAVTRQNLLDERFFLYFEDVDLCRRMWESGWEVLYQPAATLVHQHRRQSARKLFHPAKRHHFLSLMKFLWKYRLRPKPSD
jgi:N-acetylglucosaminyl-diphospho-decaprenol L-rhamnosyltransferase